MGVMSNRERTSMPSAMFPASLRGTREPVVGYGNQGVREHGNASSRNVGTLRSFLDAMLGISIVALCSRDVAGSKA